MPASSEAHAAPTRGNPYMRDLLETSVLAAVIGALTGLVAIGVRIAIAFVTGVSFRQRVELSFTHFIPPFLNDLGPWVIVVPAVGALVGWVIVRVVAKDDRIRGSTEVVRGVATRRGKVSRRALVAHSLATIVTVGAGGSAGREGAMVQLGAALGMMASNLRGASVRHRKVLLAAGGAAAIGATFNTPIAGVIFAAEVILVEWSTRSFIPLTVSSAMGVLVASRFLGDEPAFPIPAYELVTATELWLYLVLGVLAGILSIASLRALHGSDRLFARIPGPAWVRPVIGGLVVGLVAFYVPQVLGVGYETVSDVLHGRYLEAYGILAIILFAKLFAFAITRGSGGASGAFSPALFMGAALGGVFGAIVNVAFPGVVGGPGAYALVGMGAVFAAVTRASLTAIVMLYEMTHTFSIVIPIMLAVVVADALAKAYGEGNYFRGMRGERAMIETDAAVNVLDVVDVREIMTKQVESVTASSPVRHVVEKRFTTGHQGYPVVDDLGSLVGIITATDMRRKVKEGDLDRPVSEFMTVDVVTVTPSTSAHEALTEMVRMDVGHLPVVDDKDARKLVGFLTRTDLVGVEKRVIAEEERQEPELRGIFRRRPKGPNL